MTDQELLELIQRADPGDLTPQELAEIESRLPESASIRNALAGRLQLDESVACTLGRPDVSVSAILREQRRQQTWGWIAPSLGVGLCIMAAVFGGLVLYRAVFLDPIELAETDATAVVDDDAQDDQSNEIISVDEEPPAPDESVQITDPVIAVQREPATPVETLPYAREAEDFQQGNVKVNRREWGTDEVEVIHSTETPAFVEYEFALATDTELELQLRYAAFDSRPLVALINGRRLANSVAAEQTGGGTAEHQTWITAGAHPFTAGRNTLRFETTGRFPHIDQWRLQLPTAVSEPTTDPGKPWSGVLAADYQPLNFRDVCFNEFDLAKSHMRLDDVQNWFATVADVTSRIRPSGARNLQGGQVEGVVRLKSPWDEGVALRLRPKADNRLDIHFFRGQRGITFSYYRHQLDSWAVYSTTREPGSPTPDSFLLAATDNGRNRRTEIPRGGSYILRFAAGELALSRGDILLAAGQLGGVPDEVFFEGSAIIEGLQLLRTVDGASREPVRKVAQSLDRPADWKWSPPSTDGAEVQTLPDGSIQLIADKTDQRGWITTPVSNIGARMIDWEIRDPQPGAGIFLGRGKNGEPQEIVRFFRNARDGKLAVGIAPNDDGRDRDFTSPQERLTPLVGDRVWIRMLFGAGIFHWWVSHDGQHWARADQPWIDRPGDVTHLGVHYVPRTENCGLTIAAIKVRELKGLAGVAPQKFIEQSPETLHTAAKYAEWFAHATLAQPEGVDDETWLRACTVQTFRSGVSRSLGAELLQRLIENSIDSLSTSAQIDLLADAALLFDLRDNQALIEQLVRYGADVAAANRQHNVSDQVRRRLMTAPFHSNPTPAMFDWREVDANLIRLVYEEDASLANYVTMLRFFHFDDRTKLDDWAAAQAGGDLVRRSKRLPVQWRHPYREQIDKSVYNGFAEIRALVESEAYEDAARRVATIDAARFEGLAPYGGGVDWMVSFMTAVRQMQRENPALTDAIQSKFSSLASLRLQRSINEQNGAAIAAIAAQFTGTAAAGEAHQWLGDQALASGWFPQAISEYRMAQENSGDTNALNARLRLAGAMTGELLGKPATSSVRFGENELTAKAFESLIASLHTRNSEASHGSTAFERGLLPEPTSLRLENKSRLDGPFGNAASTEGVRNTYAFNVDWAGKQIAVAVEDSTAYVSNRFQVAAYKLSDGARIWRSQSPPGLAQMKAQALAFTPMQPVVRGDLVFARQMFGKGPMLVCLNRNDGKIVWSKSGTDEEFFASDPMFIDGRLAAVGARRKADNNYAIEWWQFDEETGVRTARSELIEVAASWQYRSHCAIANAGAGAVIALGGVVVKSDSAGNVRWVRRQKVTPPEEDETWVRQYSQPPVIRDGRVFVVQPGVRTVDCLDIETGQLIWQAVLPTIERLLTLTNEAAIVQTANSIAALDAATGESIWRRPLENSFYTGYAVGADRLMMIEEVKRSEQVRWTAQLRWFDLRTGNSLAACPLKSVTESEMRLGPIVHSADELFIFRGRGKTDPNRDFSRLATFKDGELLTPGQLTDYPTGAPDLLVSAAEKQFADWQLLSGDARSAGLQANVEGKSDVFVVRASGGTPATFGQHLTIPTKGNPKLKIEVGQRATHLYLVKIFVDGEKVAEQKTDELPGGPPWGTLEFDLTPWAGKKTRVGVQGVGRYGGEEVDTLWRRIEITQ